MKLEAKTRLVAGKADFKAVITALTNVRKDMDKLKETLDSSSAELLRREIVRLGDVIEGVVKLKGNSSIKARADAPMIAQPTCSSTENPLEDGAAFDTLDDGEVSDDDPAVQTVTRDDGGVEEAPEQDLLNDDLVVPKINFA